MRFLLYIAILGAILPIVFTRPFFGLCIYYVVSLLQPKVLCWRGDFQDAVLVGVPMVVGAIAFGTYRIVVEPIRDRGTRRIVGATKKLVRSPLFELAWPFAAFLALIIYIAVVRLLVPYPMSNTSYQFRGLCKVMLVVVLLTGLASDLRRFRILYIVVAMAAAFWAIKGGFKVILLGPHQVYGKTYDNNLFALVSVMALPMMFYFALSVKHARWRPLLLCLAALMCLGIIGSRSRAGFVAFALVLMCMAWSSRYRLRAVFAVGLVAAVALTMSGQEIRERVVSILEYRDDKSVEGRLYTWEVAQKLLRRHPVIGVGFNNFEVAKDRLAGGRKAAHNIYLQNLAELGLLGHPLWLIIIFGTMISLYRFMRRSRRLPPDMRWAYYWSRGLLLGLAAFCIHGLFHNEEYLELMFVMVGLNIALQTVVRRELRDRGLLELAEKATRLNRLDGRSRRRRPSVPHHRTMFEPPRQRRAAGSRGPAAAFSPGSGSGRPFTY
ncbi:MAG: O-antigen ligase family protein [Phycisphaerae bacterium]|nr:O-antigen ligase family protein [Phycisphaerae bacterium]